MAKYKEEQTTGQSWQRCYRVVIDNALNSTATATFHEEKVFVLGDNLVNQPVTACIVSLSPQAEFPILDPVTNQPTGQMLTHQQLYTYIYSLYIKTATDRDNQTFGPIV